MISVVLPTMWNGCSIPIMLPRILDRPEVSEFIVVDNDVNKTPDWFKDLYRHPKIVYWPQKHNTGVNAAWKIGLDKARSDFVLFIEDDVGWNVEALDPMAKACDELQEKALIGVGPGQTHTLIETDLVKLLEVMKPAVEFPWALKQFGPTEQMTIHWAQLFLCHKARFIEMDPEFIVFYGDEVMFYGNRFHGYPSYWIQNNLVLRTPNAPAVWEFKKKQFDMETILAERYFAKYQYKSPYAIWYNGNQIV